MHNQYLYYVGYRVDIVANYVRVTIEQNKGIYEYEVRCEPSIDSRDLIFKVVGQHREILGPAKTFDGVTLYLPFQFPNNVTINVLTRHFSFLKNSLFSS